MDTGSSEVPAGLVPRVLHGALPPWEQALTSWQSCFLPFSLHLGDRSHKSVTNSLALWLCKRLAASGVTRSWFWWCFSLHPLLLLMQKNLCIAFTASISLYVCRYLERTIVNIGELKPLAPPRIPPRWSPHEPHVGWGPKNGTTHHAHFRFCAIWLRYTRYQCKQCTPNSNSAHTPCSL